MNKQNSMALIIVNIIAAVGTVIFNGLSQALPIGISTNAEIANRLPIYFFPANFTFSIWGVIFFGWLVFAVYQALPAQRSNPFVQAVGWWFALSCLGNIGWLLTFQNELFAPSIPPIAFLGVALGVIYVRLRRVQAPVRPADFWCIFVPFSVYFAWVIVANVANVTYTLEAAGWDGFGIASQTWGAIMLVVAGLIGGAVAFINRDIAVVAVIIWAFGGIIARYPGIQSIAWTAGGVAALVAVAVIGYSLFSRSDAENARLPAR